MEVYVIRHTPVADQENRCYGQIEVPLRDDYLSDFKKIKQLLPSNFDAVYCSSSNRCLQLAQYFSAPSMIPTPELLELSFGDWEGKFWEEIDREQLNAWMTDFVFTAPKNGESLYAMNERVKFFLANLRSSKLHKILVITHAGVIRCIWSNLLEIPLSQLFKIPVGFFEVLAFNLENDARLDKIVRLT
jgi:alpha-ribazole phosphatase